MFSIVKNDGRLLVGQDGENDYGDKRSGKEINEKEREKDIYTKTVRMTLLVVCLFFSSRLEEVVVCKPKTNHKKSKQTYQLLRS